MTRGILDEPIAQKIWSKALHREYERWKDKKKSEEKELQKQLQEAERLKATTPQPSDRK